MSRDKNEPRVVAELGRPETPEETAQRKSQDSKNHRNRQTINNLVFSLLASVALVVFIVLIVPRGNENLDPKVDYIAAAAQAQPSVFVPLAAPHLPPGWGANLAELRQGADGVQSWNIGLITPDQQYLGVAQGIDANPSWLTNQLASVPATGHETIDSVTWTVYDNRAASGGKGNYQYALSTTQGESTYLLFGTATDADFRLVAAAITDGETE